MVQRMMRLARSFAGGSDPEQLSTCKSKSELINYLRSVSLASQYFRRILNSTMCTSECDVFVVSSPTKCSKRIASSVLV